MNALPPDATPYFRGEEYPKLGVPVNPLRARTKKTLKLPFKKNYVRTLTVRSPLLTNFEMHNTVLLPMGRVLYRTSLYVCFLKIYLLREHT